MGVSETPTHAKGESNSMSSDTPSLSKRGKTTKDKGHISRLTGLNYYTSL